MERLAAVHHLLLEGAHHLELLRVHQVRIGLADEVLGGHAERRVHDPLVPQVPVLHGGAVRRVAAEQPEPLLALAQRRFGTLALGGVVAHTDHADDRPAPVTQRPEDDVEDELAHRLLVDERLARERASVHGDAEVGRRAGGLEVVAHVHADHLVRLEPQGLQSAAS